MSCVKPGPRAFQDLCKAPRKCLAHRPRVSRRQIYSNSLEHPNKLPNPCLAQCLLGLGFSAAFLYGSWHLELRELHAEAPPTPVEIKIDKPKNTKGLSKEENRDTISSQHLQVKRSWENPGVYAWGSNSGRVVAPNSDEPLVKFARRIPFFDGMLLRDIKLDQDFGAAITESGDLLQWGTGYSEDARKPVTTLKGKRLVSLAISRDRIIALGSNGNVYSLPVARSDQVNGPKLSENTWIPFLTSKSPISYRLLQVKTSRGEKICSISSGLEHVLILTSKGRLFSAASSSVDFPSRGQMGVSGLTWTTRPQGAYDQPHEITTLRGFDIAATTAGDYHSLALDKEGRVFAFGDNTSGQLGFEPSSESPYIDAPSLLPFSKLYAGTSLSPRVTSIAAGGKNSFFTVDATSIAHPGSIPSSRNSSLDRVTADTWACGQGILGTLGNGRWTHIQGTPKKIKTLSGLFEYDEQASAIIPIRLKRLSVGATHASATMDNVTQVHAGLSASTNSPNDTNWGADIVWWGGNEFFQLGMGRRNNIATPGYIAPMDGGDEGGKAKKREEHRFQITPKHKVKFGGRVIEVEQRAECGRMCSAVYSGV